MSNQEIFNILANNEEVLFYACIRDKDNKELKTAHDNARKALEEFAKSTGCSN